MNEIDLHKEVWDGLCARRERLPHALLLAGQRGIGKFELARKFAASLLCENRQANGEACGSCIACGWVAQGNHPDFRLLQPDILAEEAGEAAESTKKKPSQQITIDQVRDLDDFLHVGTHRQGQRVILIYPAEAMNRSTANSLLKSLEEPIANTLFLLVTDEQDRLLPTLRSRCQVISIALPSRARGEAWLRAAGVGDADQWLALAGGAPRLAAQLGGSEARALLEALIGHMATGGKLDPLAAAAAVDKVIKAEKGQTPLKHTLEWAQKWLFDLALSLEGLPARYFVSRDRQLKQLAATTHRDSVLAFHRKALQYKAYCEQPLNTRLFLEAFFMSYLTIFRTH